MRGGGDGIKRREGGEGWEREDGVRWGERNKIDGRYVTMWVVWEQGAEEYKWSQARG